MNIQQRTDAFIRLGKNLVMHLSGEKKIPALDSAIEKSYQQNGWFTRGNVRYALSAIAEMISEKNSLNFLNNYHPATLLSPISEGNNDSEQKSGDGIVHSKLPHLGGGGAFIGVIMPSNIPLAGFHDFFCVLMSGNIFVGKCSSQDKILLPAISEMLNDIEPKFKKFIRFKENKLDKIDAVIATGSNNSSRYFEYYFGKYPHIIRKNRNSVAILTGNETREEIKLLGNDIFRYFGLGCRNVSKFFVPENYEFKNLFEGLFDWQEIINHNKYANNYTYNKALYLMNKIKIWDNGFLLLKEDVGLSSPVAVLFYEYYQNEKQLNERLQMDKEQIQCIVCTTELYSVKNNCISFGKAQHPQLSDYADGIDTMKFLLHTYS